MFCVNWFLIGQPNPGPFVFIFVLFNILTKNSFQWDSNLDHRIRRQTLWPLDHHHHCLGKFIFAITIFFMAVGFELNSSERKATKITTMRPLRSYLIEILRRCEQGSRSLSIERPQVNSEIQYLIFLYKIVDYCVSWLNIFMIGSEIEIKIGSHFYGSGL